MLPTKIKNKECGIVNLDNHIGAGAHWVCYRNIDRFCEYFDSFGLPMPIEVKKYMKKSGKRLVYSTDIPRYIDNRYSTDIQRVLEDPPENHH